MIEDEGIEGEAELPAEDDDLPFTRGEQGKRDSYLRSPRALPACAREFDRLAAAVLQRVTALGEREGAAKAEVRRALGRCIVQFGPVALTLSWVRARSDTVADGRLLILEWQGTVLRANERIPERAVDPRPGKSATLVRETSYLADATGEADWRWRLEDAAADSDGLSSDQLATRCVDAWIAAMPPVAH